MIKKIDVKTLILFIFLFINVTAFAISINANTIYVEEIPISTTSIQLSFGFLCIILSLTFITLIYNISYRLFHTDNLDLPWKKSNFIGYFLLGIQILFLIFNNLYHVNTAGSITNINEIPVIYRYFFVIFNPDILFILYACSAKNKKILLSNTSIYIISTISRGWSGGILFVLLIMLIRRNKISYASLFFIFIGLLFLSPYLISIKWYFRDPSLSFYNALYSVDYISSLHSSLQYIISRLQQLTNVTFIVQNIDYFSLQYIDGHITPYWAENFLIKNIYSLYHPDSITLGHALSEKLVGNPVAWNSNPGLAGWMTILLSISIYQFILFFMILIITIFILIYLASQLHDHNTINFIYVFSLLFLFPGWMGMYFNLIIYLFLWVTLTSFSKKWFF
ncbi:oligosaccharide repeat unit polymerase [Morganella morganii]|uniref:oligosaccharide repeat unit polymerase n=1 Tax=Morganella morganii TaxID=582 RepID=UPI002AB4C000|nr:oligosaccharide repeat unit polymerase [Serratia marcescens]